MVMQKNWNKKKQDTPLTTESDEGCVFMNSNDMIDV